MAEAMQGVRKGKLAFAGCGSSWRLVAKVCLGKLKREHRECAVLTPSVTARTYRPDYAHFIHTPRGVGKLQPRCVATLIPRGPWTTEASSRGP